MTRISIIGFSCLIILSMFVSCDSSDCRDGSLSPLDSRVMFSVGEDHNCPAPGCSPSIVLRMVTEKTYGCCNFSIETSAMTIDKTVFVSFRGICKPSVCLTMIGPASSVRYLRFSTGTYSLRFSHDDRVDAYELVVTDDAIKIIGEGSGLTEPTERLVWRYPPRSFSYLCGTLTENSWICDAFADSMLSTGLYTEFAFPDSGQIPYRVSSSGYYYDMPGRYFLYQDEADFDTAGAILGRFARETTSQHEGNGLTLRNWRDEWFASWMMEDQL